MQVLAQSKEPLGLVAAAVAQSGFDSRAGGVVFGAAQRVRVRHVGLIRSDQRTIHRKQY